MGEGAKQSDIDYKEVMRRMGEVLEENNKAMAKTGAAMMDYLISYDAGMRKVWLEDLKKTNDEVGEGVSEALKDLKKTNDEVIGRVREALKDMKKTNDEAMERVFG